MSYCMRRSTLWLPALRGVVASGPPIMVQVRDAGQRQPHKVSRRPASSADLVMRNPAQHPTNLRIDMRHASGGNGDGWVGIPGG